MIYNQLVHMYYFYFANKKEPKLTFFNIRKVYAAPFLRLDENRGMETNILKRIFFDENQHWDQFVKKHHKNLRPIVMKEVEKFRGCGIRRTDLNYWFVKVAMM